MRTITSWKRCISCNYEDAYELVRKGSKVLIPGDRTIITVWGDSYYLTDYATREWVKP